MKKPIIAIDIDDVLADSTEALRLLVNQRLNIDLQRHHYRIPGEYWGYYEGVWHVNGIKDRLSMDELDPQMKADQAHIPLMKDASRTLRKLSKSYELVIVSARSLDWYDATIVWIDQNIPGVFSRVVFAGGYEGIKQKHKGLLCRELGADWLIDDNVEHAEAAISEGINAVIFGEYGWHHKGIPDRAIVCKDWREVEEYFAAQG